MFVNIILIQGLPVNSRNVFEIDSQKIQVVPGKRHKYIHTGCPKKNALLSLKAYNSGLEAAIGTSRDSFGILRL